LLGLNDTVVCPSAAGTSASRTAQPAEVAHRHNRGVLNMSQFSEITPWIIQYTIC